MIINDLLVEAVGVELSRVLRTRKLLIPGTATTAKKAPLPDPLYVYCTKMIFVLKSNRHHTAATVLDSQGWIEKHLASRDAVSHPLFISSVRRLAVWITSGLPVIRQIRTAQAEVLIPRA
jgi:hypothetical protein